MKYIAKFKTEYSKSSVIELDSRGVIIYLCLTNDGNIYRTQRNISGLTSNEHEVEISDLTKELIEDSQKQQGNWGYNYKLCRLMLVQEYAIANNGGITHNPLYKCGDYKNYYIAHDWKDKACEIQQLQKRLDEQTKTLNNQSKTIQFLAENKYGTHTEAIVSKVCKIIEKQETKQIKDAANLKIIADKKTIKDAKIAKALKIKEIKKISGKNALIFRAVWYEYPTGNRPNGGGGWSRRAKYRPLPERVEVITSDVIIQQGDKRVISPVDGFDINLGASVYVNGKRKLKLNLYHYESGRCLIRDYENLE